MTEHDIHEPGTPDPGATSHDPTTEAEFHDALKELLRRARENGVDVEGGWSFRNGGDHTGWGVEIYAVVRDPDGTTADSRTSSHG